jgi:cell division protein ZapA (FtsZ GTPase activity inhibitor)
MLQLTGKRVAVASSLSQEDHLTKAARSHAAAAAAFLQQVQQLKKQGGTVKATPVAAGPVKVT